MAITTPQGFDLQAPEPLELKTVRDTIVARDGISLVTRYEGLKVYVKETQGSYQLRGGITNTDWVLESIDTTLFYTKLNLQTPGEALVHWDNITNVPILSEYWESSAGTYGDILNPVAGVKELFLEENSQGLTMFTFKNTNDVDNYAATVIAMKGSGPDFTNTLVFGNYNTNYYVSEWAGSGVLATDNDLILGSVGASTVINFQLGGGFTTPITVFKLDTDKVLKTLTTGYEALVLDDNDIPNKKYVDDIVVSTDTVWGTITGLITDQLDLMTLLNSKENVFLKNTGFNKDLGITTGTVAEGNHTHAQLHDQNTDYKIEVPESSAIATSTGLELNEIKHADYVVQPTSLAHKEGRMFYDETSNTFRAYNDIADVALDIGQELWGRVDNDNAYTLYNGKVGYVKGASVPAGNLLCDLADASVMGQSERVLGVFTNDIAPGGVGYITRYGVVRDMDTSLWAEGDLLYLDAHNPGELTNERPVSPHYPVRVAIVMYSDPLVGAIGVDTLAFTGSDTSVAADGIIDGVVMYKQHIEVVVEGGIIYADVTRDDSASHDLPFLIDGVRYALNTTTNTGPGGAARIAIPPGASSTETQNSRLYIRLNAGVPELAITTSAVAEPYANLATFAVFDAARTLADGQPLMYRRANNAVSSEDIGIDGSFGLLTVAINAIRFKLGSNWLLGQDATPEVNNTTIRTTLSAGLGAQLHVSNIPVFDGLNYLLYNDTTNVVTYENSTNLTDIVTDASGDTLLANNTFYTIRLFYQLNSNGIGNNVIATRPTGHYTNAAEAIQDPLRYTVNINDTTIEEVVYPIYDLVIGRTGGAGATISLEKLTDLRTKIAGGVGGGGASGGGGTDDKVRVSAADTVNDYLFPKLVEGDGITLEIVNPGLTEQIRISSSGDITTVGTGGDYATIQLALAAGKYNLKLISDVTETVDWGTHTKDINIFAAELTILNLSIANSSNITVRATNISFNISGTAQLFTYLSKIFVESCEILGDTSNNDFRGAVYGNDLYLQIGSNGFRIDIYDVIGLDINGLSSTGGEEIAIRIFGSVTNVTMTGAFALGIDLHDGVMRNVKGDGQSGIRIRGTVGSSIYDAKGIRIYVRNDTLSTLVNCDLFDFHIYATSYNAFKSVDNCSLDVISAPYAGGNINTLYGFKNVNNTTFTFADVHIINDDTTLQNCKVTNGTIIVDATADKPTIIGCRTNSSIVDNGTNTQLLANNLL